MTDPIASDSFIQGLFQVSRQGPVGGSASVGSQKPNYCGLQRISRSFEKQTSLHPDCGFACSGSQSVWALVRDHFGCWKNHSWILVLVAKATTRVVCGWPLSAEWRVRKGMWFGAQGGLSTRSEGGRPCREVLTQPVLAAFSSGFLRNAFPSQQWPFLLTHLEFYLDSNHLEHWKVPYPP